MQLKNNPKWDYFSFTGTLIAICQLMFRENIMTYNNNTEIENNFD